MTWVRPGDVGEAVLGVAGFYQQKEVSLVSRTISKSVDVQTVTFGDDPCNAQAKNKCLEIETQHNLVQIEAENQTGTQQRAEYRTGLVQIEAENQAGLVQIEAENQAQAGLVQIEAENQVGQVQIDIVDVNERGENKSISNCDCESGDDEDEEDKNDGSAADDDDDDDDDDDNDDDDNDDDDDDDKGWITPSNLEAVNKLMSKLDVGASERIVQVACMTTDFAMQVRQMHTQTHKNACTCACART